MHPLQQSCTGLCLNGCIVSRCLNSAADSHPFSNKKNSTKSVTLHNTTTTSIETLKSVLVLVGCLLIGAWGLWVLALTVATWPPKASSSSSQVHVAIADTTFLWRLRRPVAAAPAPTSAATTLVLYVYSGSSDPACLDNLRYFVRTAVKEDDGVEYVFAVQLVCGCWVVSDMWRTHTIGVEEKLHTDKHRIRERCWMLLHCHDCHEMHAMLATVTPAMTGMRGVHSILTTTHAP